MQEVIGSTPIFSTQPLNAPDNQVLNYLSGAFTDKSQPRYLSLQDMATPEIQYTIPKVVKGKKVEVVPKGSTKAKEEANKNWYVEFFFLNPKTEKMERFRPSKGLNRIKDPKEKNNSFNELCAAYKAALDGGWNPFDDLANEKLKREIVSLTLEKAKDLFEDYHKAKGTRKKSIQTYLSKVNQLITYYGAEKRLQKSTILKSQLF